MNGSSINVRAPEVIIVPDGVVLVVGRGEADVCLSHPAISRRHAELRGVSGGITVRDLNSLLGVRVNGERLREQRVLREWNRVDFGPFRYLYTGGQLRLLDQGSHSLEGRDLVVARNGRELLSGVNFTIGAGHFVGILGPSGSGKTTLMKCLAGFVPPVRGRLSFDGMDLPLHVESYRAVVGYVPQEDVIYLPLTARENLDFSLRLRLADDLGSKERADAIARVLEQLRLAPQADQTAKTLSGGERKRLNVAVELLTRPKILFLDEPTSGLDPAAETRLMRLLREVAGKGTTVVCSTHAMENLALFDHVYVLAEETLVYSGSPSRLLAHFALPSYPALYEHLERRGRDPSAPAGEALAAPVGKSRVLSGIILVKPNRPPALSAGSARIGIRAQVVTQCLRGLRLIWRDKAHLFLLLGQPVLIGLLINLSQLRPDGLDPIFLFAVVTSIWLGLNNTAREVVRDRPIYARERLAGVTPEGYLAAKALLYGLVGLVQLVLLVFMIRFANFLSPNNAQALASWPVLYVTLVLWVTYMAAMVLGLLVSTAAPSQEAAVATLPLVILPQLLLTGVATGLRSARDGAFQPLAVLLHHAGEGSRGIAGWLLELTSMLTYSRPALALFRRVRPDEVAMPVALVGWFDALHLLTLLVLTATLLLFVFYRQEQAWLARW